MNNTVKELKDELSGVKGDMEKMMQRYVELDKDLNKKDVELNELAAEVKSLKALTNDMGGSLFQQENEMKKVQQQAELVMKASSVVDNNKLIEEKMEETNNLVQTHKEDIKKTYVEILKEKEEMKHQKVEKRDIRKEVREVIRSNPKSIKDTVDINTSVVFIGVKQVDIFNTIDRDKKELDTISKLLTTVAGEGEEEEEKEKKK